MQFTNKVILCGDLCYPPTRSSDDRHDFWVFDLKTVERLPNRESRTVVHKLAVPDTVCLQDGFNRLQGTERIYVNGRINLLDGELARCIMPETIHLLSRAKASSRISDPSTIIDLRVAEPVTDTN